MCGCLIDGLMMLLSLLSIGIYFNFIVVYTYKEYKHYLLTICSRVNSGVVLYDFSIIFFQS
jgi:hypothetical protein